MLLAPALSCATGERAARVPEVPARASAGVARPAGCTTRVTPGAPLQAAIDAADDGAVLCLTPGTHAGPVRITRPVTLWGPRDAVVKSSGVGTTIESTADHVALLGFTVDGSGGRYDTEDAAVAVRKSNDVRIEGLRVVNAVFGILAEQSNRVRIAFNEVRGDPTSPLGLRGDGVRMWEVRKSTVEGNHVWDSRDMVIWYSPGNHILRNTVERSRYGTHFMYSHDNVVEDNVYRSNVVGIFSMYSRGLKIHDNYMLDSSGAGGMGLGTKEAGSLDVRGNHFAHNETAVYLDNTPLDQDDHDTFEGNTFALNDNAVIFHGRTQGNRFLYNAFASNRRQVVVEGGGDALDARFRGNYFDDYQGYDLNEDGHGDIPYELRSLSEQLTASHPELQFFRGTPALGVVEALGRLVPLFAPKTIVSDPEPAMIDPTREVSRAR